MPSQKPFGVTVTRSYVKGLVFFNEHIITFYTDKKLTDEDVSVITEALKEFIQSSDQPADAVVLIHLEDLLDNRGIKVIDPADETVYINLNF